ncbi:MAG: hypothetical protein R3D85_05705 [Paracoccaceae bacterium]
MVNYFLYDYPALAAARRQFKPTVTVMPTPSNEAPNWSISPSRAANWPWTTARR